jgi:hypothetical protein
MRAMTKNGTGIFEGTNLQCKGTMSRMAKESTTIDKHRFDDILSKRTEEENSDGDDISSGESSDSDGGDD